MEANCERHEEGEKIVKKLLEATSLLCCEVAI